MIASTVGILLLFADEVHFFSSQTWETIVYTLAISPGYVAVLSQSTLTIISPISFRAAHCAATHKMGWLLSQAWHHVTG